MLQGKYEVRENAISKCFRVARDGGYEYFGVQHGGQCFAGNGDSYQKYGKKDGCKDGKGGGHLNDVYRIPSKCFMILEHVSNTC